MKKSGKQKIWDAADGLAALMTSKTPLDAAADEQDAATYDLAADDEHRAAFATASLLQQQGKLEEAAALWLEVIEGQTAALGANHASTLLTKANYAGVLGKQGKLHEAECIYQEVIEGQTVTLGAGDVSTLLTQYNFGPAVALRVRHQLDLRRVGVVGAMNHAIVLQQQGKLEEAGRLYLVVIKGSTAAHGANHESTLMTKCNYAGVLKDQGKLEEAERIYREAIEGLTASLSPNHSTTLRNKGSYALVLEKQGKLEEAERLYQEVIEGQTAALGAGHDSTLITKYNLGALLLDAQWAPRSDQPWRDNDAAAAASDRARAWPLFEEVAAGWAAALGEDHQRTQDARRALVRCRPPPVDDAQMPGTLINSGDDTAAAGGTLATDEAVSAAFDAATQLEDQGRLQEAAAMWPEVIAGYELLDGLTGENTLVAKSNYADLLRQQGRLEEAGTLYLTVIEGETVALGDNHAITLGTKNNYAIVLRKQGKLDEAEQIFLEVIEGFTATLGTNHADTLTTKANYAHLLKEQGKLEEAGRQRLEVIAGFTATLGANHASTLASKNNYANVLQKQGKLDEAERVYLQVIEGFTATLGASHASTLTTKRSYARLLMERSVPELTTALGVLTVDHSLVVEKTELVSVLMTAQEVALAVVLAQNIAVGMQVTAPCVHCNGDRYPATVMKLLDREVPSLQHGKCELQWHDRDSKDRMKDISDLLVRVIIPGTVEAKDAEAKSAAAKAAEAKVAETEAAAAAAAAAAAVAAAEASSAIAATQLRSAARSGNTTEIESLAQALASDPSIIDAKAKPSITKDFVVGSTALMQAAYWGHANAVELLLALHADIKLTDNRGMTALAMVQGDPRVQYDNTATILPMLLAYESAVAASQAAPTPRVLKIAIQAHRETLARDGALRFTPYAVERFGQDDGVFSVFSLMDAASCPRCSKPFGLTLSFSLPLGKYSCGGCGTCVCDGCSQRRFVLVPEQGYQLDASGKSELRVCDDCPNPEMSPPATLAEFCKRAELPQLRLLEYDVPELRDLLKSFANVGMHLRHELIKQHRELLGGPEAVLGAPVPAAVPTAVAAETAEDKFEAFFSRMGTSTALDGLDRTPISSLHEAVEFIIGADGAPTEAMFRRGCDQAYAKADALLAPDEHGLTREEIAAIFMYTQENVGGGGRSLYSPLNRALFSEARGAVKPYWGYLKLLQHALFKLPKCDAGAIYRGIKDPYVPMTEAEMLAKATESGGSGEPEVWWGFSSCSTDLQATKGFLGQSGERVLYTVEGGSSARDVRRYSEFEKENEVLMPFGSAFTVVTALDTGNGMLIITLCQDQGFVFGSDGE